MIFSIRSVLFFSASLFLALPCFAENPYLSELIQQAKELSLSSRAEWRTLLHYKSNTFLPGETSLADDPKFFLAPSGKRDSEAELEATLTRFFDPPLPPDEVTKLHPQCSFPARYAWLKQELEFDLTRLPEIPCPRLEEWLKALDVASVSLIYPADYLNNPASMFGHTMIRLDAHGQNEKTRLLAYAANYAADTGTDNLIFFAVKGLTGMYSGRFGILPYYAQVRLYSDLESRDIWEYQLNFTPEEINRLLLHLWELSQIYFDYYFFDENCSYHLLSLFEAARPGLNLTDRYHAAALPTDTIRDTIQEIGLVGKAVYRPSSATVVRHDLAHLSREEIRTAKEIVREKISPENTTLPSLSAESQARVLEFTSNILEYNKLSGRDDGPEIDELNYKVLTARSKLTVLPDIPPVPTPKIPPEEGHLPRMLAIGGGAEDGRLFSELRFHPAYHALLDPDGGYVEGANILMFDTRLRIDEERDLFLDSLSVLDIKSLSPRDEFIQPLSWRLHFGYEQEKLSSDKDRSMVSLDGGAGLTYALFPRVWTYILAEAAADVSVSDDGHGALGIGGSGGTLITLGERWKINLSGKAVRFPAFHQRTEQEITLEQRWTLTSQSALVLSLSRKEEFDNWFSEGLLSIQYYF